jgi:hypothetical protein
MRNISRLKVFISLVIALLITTAAFCNTSVVNAESGVYVVSVDPMELICYQGDHPSLPAYVEANMSDGTVQELPVSWTPSTIFTTRWAQTYNFSGILDSSYGYTGTITFKLIVKPKVLLLRKPTDTIVIDQGSSYTLPEILEAVTVNAEPVKLPVIWQTPIINTDNAGIYQLIGTMDGYSQEIKWDLLVNPVVNVGLGENYDLPETLPVYRVDGTCSEAEVIWDANNVQTGTAGTYKYTGTVNGINKPVTLTLNVG